MLYPQLTTLKVPVINKPLLKWRYKYKCCISICIWSYWSPCWLQVFCNHWDQAAVRVCQAQSSELTHLHTWLNIKWKPLASPSPWAAEPTFRSWSGPLSCTWTHVGVDGASYLPDVSAGDSHVFRGGLLASMQTSKSEPAFSELHACWVCLSACRACVYLLQACACAGWEGRRCVDTAPCQRRFEASSVTVRAEASRVCGASLFISFVWSCHPAGSEQRTGDRSSSPPAGKEHWSDRKRPPTAWTHTHVHTHKYNRRRQRRACLLVLVNIWIISHLKGSFFFFFRYNFN